MRIIILLCVILCGCTTVKIHTPKADISITYFLQDKKAKSLKYNPETQLFELEQFGSETSQVVGEAVRAAIGGLK